MPQSHEWLRCRKFIRAALEYSGGTHTVEDIGKGIDAGLFQFWPGRKSAIVTELVNYPRAKALRFFLAGGDLDELREMERVLVLWGRSKGCTRVEIAGRQGWERALDGYERLCVVLVKEIG